MIACQSLFLPPNYMARISKVTYGFRPSSLNPLPLNVFPSRPALHRSRSSPLSASAPAPVPAPNHVVIRVRVSTVIVMLFLFHPIPYFIFIHVHACSCPISQVLKSPSPVHS